MDHGRGANKLSGCVKKEREMRDGAEGRIYILAGGSRPNKRMTRDQRPEARLICCERYNQRICLVKMQRHARWVSLVSEQSVPLSKQMDNRTKATALQLAVEVWGGFAIVRVPSRCKSKTRTLKMKF